MRKVISTMTDGSTDVLVLGLGNLLLRDDGLGLRLLEALAAEGLPAEFLDGGTQGLALLSHLAGRRTLIILDAVALGAPPGTVHVLQGDSISAHHAVIAHGSNALELLAAARLIGDLPPSVTIFGIEPECISTGIGLSPAVEAAIPEALSRARTALESAIRPAAKTPFCSV
jgi:hydrogenase maturation protease